MSAEQPDFEFETILPHVHRVDLKEEMIQYGACRDWFVKRWLPIPWMWLPATYRSRRRDRYARECEFSHDEPDPIAIMNAYADQIGQQTGYRPYVLYGTTPLNFKRADRGPVDMRWRRTLRRRARRKNRREHRA